MLEIGIMKKPIELLQSRVLPNPIPHALSTNPLSMRTPEVQEISKQTKILV
jgi:hypothetical protein